MANHKRERYVQKFEKMIDNLEYYEALKIVGILYHTCAHYHQRMGQSEQSNGNSYKYPETLENQGLLGFFYVVWTHIDRKLP